MTQAQREYLGSHGIDPWALAWANANELGHENYGASEVAVLPNGKLLMANGKVLRTKGVA